MFYREAGVFVNVSRSVCLMGWELSGAWATELGDTHQVLAPSAGELGDTHKALVISGATVRLQAGRDGQFVGSEMVSTNGTTLSAGQDLLITAVTDTQKEGSLGTLTKS